MAVKIVTDSTSDIPPEMAKELGITVVPLTVFFGEEAFKDGVEMGHDEFFERLTKGGVQPRTTQPTPGDFEAVYQAIAKEGNDIVSIHVSDKLSGTMNSARTAAADVSGVRVELVDTQFASLAITLIAKAAAEAANGGASVDEVVAIAREVTGKVDLYFVLDTLEFLQKGGRIGKAQALIGGLLSIKPVLKMMDGEIHPHTKVRSHAKAMAKLKEIVSTGGPYDEIAFIHEAPEDEVTAMVEFATPLTSKPVIVSNIGAVVGTYTGPGVLGFALRRV
jgi:DegV family protein with EDD domain